MTLMYAQTDGTLPTLSLDRSYGTHAPIAIPLGSSVNIEGYAGVPVTVTASLQGAFQRADFLLSLSRA
jgi:hypothetical protein